MGACRLRERGFTTRDSYNPDAVVTRAQMAAFSYRIGGALGCGRTASAMFS
jgi:hypothetical protein